MNQQRELTVQIRTGTGKGEAHKLRASGKIPGVIYGHGGEHLTIALDPLLLRKAADPARKRNTWYAIRVQEEGKADRVESCIIVDRQLDLVRDDILHVDFLRVDPNRELEIKLPLEFTGRAAGVAVGGTLKTIAREVRVAVKPADVPTSFIVDVTPLEGGQTLRVRDVKFPEGRLLDHPNIPLVLVESAKVKQDEGAEAAAGKKPAAGKAAPAKAAPAKAAAAPAKDAKKK
ncbi:50S ribosomal protein L25 [Nannocystis bainbridge]|uniref:Large ribosomal subunit protein bL25 n=1 Tax=Nannocystis bainbridge TaxID=2995303 RepID=A0ABT5DYY2_9BACT|nr:50S ribosomal protein L25 [Nannocystis bainbridge]MDC0718825.1 50S ribosomal protein L25 [Nannocystis bainbridge]